MVADHDAGRRLDVVVAGILGISRSRAASRIDSGEVTVERQKVTKHHRVSAGQSIEVAAPSPRTVVPPPSMPPVRYEDEHLLVIVKPAGLVVHPGPGHPDGTLVDALSAAGHELAPTGDDRRPGIVHRLDRDTSGLLVVAKSTTAASRLVAMLKAREVTRHYLALTAGVPRVGRGRIEAPIGRHPHDRKRFAVVATGRPAVTRFRTLAVGTAPGLDTRRGDVALVRCRLETGRTHQIRVHLAELGQPVVGDAVYGEHRDVARAVGLERMFLHATRLAFDHPVTGRRIVRDEPLPEELTAALGRAGIDPFRSSTGSHDED